MATEAVAASVVSPAAVPAEVNARRALEALDTLVDASFSPFLVETAQRIADVERLSSIGNLSGLLARQPGISAALAADLGSMPDDPPGAEEVAKLEAAETEAVSSVDDARAKELAAEVARLDAAFAALQLPEAHGELQSSIDARLAAMRTALQKLEEIESDDTDKLKAPDEVLGIVDALAQLGEDGLRLRLKSETSQRTRALREAATEAVAALMAPQQCDEKLEPAEANTGELLATLSRGAEEFGQSAAAADEAERRVTAIVEQQETHFAKVRARRAICQARKGELYDRQTAATTECRELLVMFRGAMSKLLDVFEVLEAVRAQEEAEEKAEEKAAERYTESLRAAATAKEACQRRRQVALDEKERAELLHREAEQRRAAEVHRPLRAAELANKVAQQVARLVLQCRVREAACLDRKKALTKSDLDDLLARRRAGDELTCEVGKATAALRACENSIASCAEATKQLEAQLMECEEEGRRLDSVDRLGAVVVEEVAQEAARLAEESYGCLMLWPMPVERPPSSKGAPGHKAHGQLAVQSELLKVLEQMQRQHQLEMQQLRATVAALTMQNTSGEATAVVESEPSPEPALA